MTIVPPELSTEHKAYFYAVAGMIRTLRPRVVGHLDLIRRYDGQTPAFAAEVLPLIDETLEAARAIDAALDVNAAPARKRFGPVYPLPSILKRARQIGVRVTLGDDSHAVADVGAGLDACLRAIADAGYRRVSYLVKSTASVEWREAALEDMTA